MITEQDFDNSINRLTFAFLGRIPRGFEQSKALWLEKLSTFHPSSLRSAVEEIIESDLAKFPTVGMLIQSCRAHPVFSYHQEPVFKFEAEDHDCSRSATIVLEAMNKWMRGERGTNKIPGWNKALELLSITKAGRYEAIHAECAGPDVRATCPSCGFRRIVPWPGIDVFWLQFPETQNWNAHLKGLVACRECDARFYPHEDNHNHARW